MLWPGRYKSGESFSAEVEKTVKESASLPNVNGEHFLTQLSGLKEMALDVALRAGYRVVNADGRQVKNSSRQEDGIVIYYSTASDNVVVRRHLGVGGMAVFIREGKVLVASGCGAKIIANAGCSDSPDLIDLHDALAAVAGLLAAGIYPEQFWRRPGS